MTALKYINLIGVELEGGWKEEPEDSTHELSVKFDCHCGWFRKDEPDKCTCKETYGYTPVKGHWWKGEMVSDPLPLNKVGSWIKKNYPEAMNESCGMHVHISFKDISSYIKMMDRGFISYFNDYMYNAGKADKRIGTEEFFYRLSGKNRFCKNDFRAIEQVVQTEARNNPIRYTLVNYCYKLHTTIECRLFPMYPTVELAGKAVVLYVDCVESYLDTVKDYVIKEEVEEEDIVLDYPIFA